MTIEYRGKPVKTDHATLEKSVRVKVPFLLRPILRAHMGSNTIFVESRFKDGRSSPRVVFYNTSKDKMVPAESRSGSSFILFGEDINENIYCKLSGVKFIPHKK